MIILQSSTSSFSYPLLPPLCCCKTNISFPPRNRKARLITLFIPRRKLWLLACAIPTPDSNKLNVKVARNLVAKGFSKDFVDGESQESSIPMGSNFTNFQQDPIVDKLRTQLGVIHPIPSPPINRNIVGLFVFFFFVGVAFDKIWTSRKKRSKSGSLDGEAVRVGSGVWPQVPTSFSSFLEKDLQRKESVEWVNMVLGKLWKVYRGGIENWIIGLLQPVIDNLKKPDYVQRVEIKQFSLGDEPLSVRNVERRTSRRANDLQYQIGLRYTGGARMLLMLSLKFGIIPIVVPVGIRDFDIDGELWVKLRLIPTEPFVGAVSWAFVSLPKIKFELSPFRLFNLMAIPVLSMFLTKLLTVDLPRLFVRPKKIVLDFQKGKAVGPVPNDSKREEIQEEKNKDFVGELSVTLVDARKLSYVFYGKTDPYVVLSLGDQVIRSKKNSQTTVIGPPGEPIWNQDFYLLVANPGKEKLRIQVKDSLGFTDFTIGTGEVDLGSLQDTVPTDKIVVLRGGWGVFRKRSRGEILLRLTYKAYVEDEEDDTTATESVSADFSDDELSDIDESNGTYEQGIRLNTDETNKESFMDVLAALIVSEEFQGIVSSEPWSKNLDDISRTGPSKTRLNGVNTEAAPSDSDKGSEPPGGSTLLWFAVITNTLVLIALNMGLPKSDSIHIREVWDDNVEEEFALIREIVDDYPYVAMDTEFPGIVLRPVGYFKSSYDYHYQTLKDNVDMLKLVQLGLTFSDEKGNLPTCGTDKYCIWQFNFREFNVNKDVFANDSIELLRQSGIDFKKNNEKGIDAMRFGELLMSSGIVLNDNVHWVTFHSGYDFGYLLKLLTCQNLPDTQVGFFSLLNIYFPTLYDIKHLMKFCNSLHGGLNKLAELLEVERVGICHQAGSDSLLTACTFRKLKENFFSGSLEKYSGVLYGLGVENGQSTY